MIESLKPVTIDGLNGYEILAKAKDIRSTTPMTIYQVVLYEGQGYYIMQGLVSTKAANAYVPSLKEMARSFKRRRPGDVN